MTDYPRFSEAFDALSAPGGISPSLVRRVFDAILAGHWTPTQVGGFMVALRCTGESAPTIAAAAAALRDAMVPVDHGLTRVIDTCGTGGDGHGTLNLSTAAAVVVAACGVPVAKHGNRAVSSRAGSADVLEALGIPLNLPASAAATVLGEAQIAFLLAPTHHPAMRHAAQARRELGIRSIFNCLGPLVNPARATCQIIGAYADPLRRVFADTLRTLGTERAWLVRGEDGLDEISPHTVTQVTELDGETIREFEIAPEDFGLERRPLSTIAGGDAQENAAALLRIWSGEPHPATDAVVLNAAAALVVAERLRPRDAAARAREALQSGAARRTFETWRSVALGLTTTAGGQ